MFTGIIEEIGTVISVTTHAIGKTVTVQAKIFSEDVKIGDSIAVNGLCLTVSKITGDKAEFDVSKESLSRSSLGSLKNSDTVNLERALQVGSRFGGHIVQGHVDGTAKVDSVKKTGQFSEIRFSTPPEMLDGMVEKGSVAVNGISLTIAALDNKSFTVSVIPVTLKDTTLGKAKPGDIVNIETDVVVKSIKKYVQQILRTDSGITRQKLQDLGFC